MQAGNRRQSPPATARTVTGGQNQTSRERRSPAGPPARPKPAHERGATALKWLHRAFEHEIVLTLQAGGELAGELVGFDDYHVALLLDDGSVVLVSKGAISHYMCAGLRLSRAELEERRRSRHDGEGKGGSL